MITKQKNRYVLVEASAPIDTSDRAVSSELVEAIIDEIGALEYASAFPKVMSQLGDRSFVLRVNRGHESTIILALSFVKSVQGREMGFYTIKTSGTIRKLVSFFKDE